MTCFLEYEADRVIVHDLIHLCKPEGWELRESSYPKLRLSARAVTAALAAAGLAIEADLVAA